tara:strand:+ start:395 stop:673 length:279 start_codon:yes stop_codon:yes gene_type:complete
MTKITKARNQVKSKFYYIFWGIATVSVVAGQVYVGNGYRSYARSLNRLFDSITPRGYYEPLVPQPAYPYNEFSLEDIDPDDYIIWLETDDVD